MSDPPPTIGAMAKVKTSHRCADCGYTTAKWVGRCPDCKAWGSLAEVAPVPTGAGRGASAAVATPTRPATPITAIAGERAGHRDRKSTRLNSSHVSISYAVFCLQHKTWP